LFILLIVEDDPTISAQIETCINSINRDIKVLKTKKGKIALKMAGIINFDAFILDIGLPDWNGIELAKELRKTYPMQPIIIESSEGDTHYQTQIHDQIENLAFLKKPFLNEKLIVKVNHALDIAQNLSTNSLKIEQNGFSSFIELKDVLYIEKVKGQRKIEIVSYHKHKQKLMREEFRNLTLSSLLDILKDKKSLLRCHKGYLINPKMIERLNYANNTVTLKYTDEEIPIGKTYKNAIDLIL